MTFEGRWQLDTGQITVKLKFQNGGRLIELTLITNVGLTVMLR